MSTEKRRLKIGVAIDAIHEQYQSGIWKGIAQRAKEQEIDLISFVGTSQDGVDQFDTHYDIIQKFAPNSGIDGVIVFSGSVTEHHGKSFTQKFCALFNEIPLVCVSEKIAGFPCIVVENAPGIERTIDHFVTTHNLRSIAFIKGPDDHAEAEQRFTAYKRCLKRNGIQFNPALVFDGSFIARDGAKAVRSLIESGVHFDGIIAVNDHTAFGVLEEMSRQDKHVPGEVSVAGFDDVQEAAVIRPALSTVRQPLFLMGQTAVDNVLQQISGQFVASETVLPTEPVYRRSCGCFSKEVENARAVHTHLSGLSKTEITAAIFDKTRHLLDLSSPNYPGDDVFQKKLKDLVDSLVWDVNKPQIRHIFLTEVDILLFSTSKYSDSVSLLQFILKEMTVSVTSLFHDNKKLAEGNNILQQASSLVREHQSFKEQRGLLDEKKFQLNINVISQRIIGSFEQRELLESIATGLPSLNINSMVLATFAKNGINREQWEYRENCELLLAYNRHLDEVTYPRGNTQINSNEIFPKKMLNTDTPHNHIFMPLYHRDEYLGYIVLEYSPNAPLFMYEELRLHISSAIQSSLLLRKFKSQSMLDELTGVYNRRGFATLGEKMLASAKRENHDVMVFYADVDGLKKINDTYGHEDGDIIINGAAKVLCETFRERDLIARIGGDEFVAVLISQHIDGLEEKIRSRFDSVQAQFNKTLKKDYYLSVSLGAAVCNMKKNEPLDKLMKRADADLFGKKRARKLRL